MTDRRPLTPAMVAERVGPMTLDGAAFSLGCSRRWLQGWLATNTDHGYKIGREWRFTELDVAAMRLAMREPAPQETDPDMLKALALCAPKRRKPLDHAYTCYAMRAGGRIKIGVAKDVSARLASFQTGSPEPLSVLATWPGDRFDEARAHEALKNHRLHGEWFSDHYEVLAFLAAKVKEQRQ